MNPADASNAWAVFDDYIDRVALKCVNTVTPKWQTKLAAFDAWIWTSATPGSRAWRIE